MGFRRQFDPEIGRAARDASVNDGALDGRLSYALAVSTSSASLQVEPGIYRVYLAERTATTSVAIATGDNSVSVALPTTGQPAGVFPGDVVERVRVLPDRPYVAAILSTGTGTLYLTQVVAL